jgi:phosphoribosylanthranilate isomerase
MMPSAPPPVGRTPSGSSSTRRVPGTSRRSTRRRSSQRLDLIQLHGDESPEYCRRFPSERIIKAVFPRTPEDLRALVAYDVWAFLADFREAGRYGGTGKSADWGLAARLGKTYPLILAGGLCIENIGEALAVVAPGAVDINSGCEKAPGIKDHDLIRRIVGMIRGFGLSGPRVIFGKET